VDLREEEAANMAREILAGSYDLIVILAHCREAMEIVGKRYEEGEYFLPELTRTGEMLRASGDRAKPLIKQGAPADKNSGTFVSPFF
jgi:methanogenic corrinoid protein MtbC1